MPTKIDQAGTYRGQIAEHGIGMTKKGYPQFVCRITAAEKWVESKEELKHFELGEPAWADWSDFDEEITGYLVLFNDTDEFSEDTALLNYHQLKTALGWDGDEFNSLAEGEHVGKKVLFRVEENEWDGKVRLQLNWLDDYEASPTNGLRTVDADTVKDLTSKLKVQKSKKNKPASAAKPSAGKSKDKSESKGEGKSEKSSKTSDPPKRQKKKEVESDNEEYTQLKAWDFIQKRKGDRDDQDIVDAWMAACESVGGDKEEEDFTPDEWAAVRDAVAKKLSLES